MTNVWAYWQAEIRARKPVDAGGKAFVPTRDEPGTLSRDTDQPIDGYWRIMGAKTKHDVPIAIWREPGTDHIVMQWDAQQPATIAEDSERFLKFRSTWFNSCAAVTKAEWDQALVTGLWPDGKPSREMSEEEKLGIDVKPGDNNAPVEETLAEQIAAQVAKAEAMAEPKTQAEADAATGVVDKLRKLWKLADEARVVEKRPHDEAAAAVQSKWLAIMNPAKDAGAALDERRKMFLKKEQQRLNDIAAEENRKRQEEARRKQQAERERLQREADARAAEEAERRREAAAKAAEEARIAEEAAAADASKRAEADRLAAEAKAAEEAAAVTVVAEEVKVPEIAVETVEAERATAGTAFGRNSGLKKTKVAVIVDIRALAEHFIHGADTDFTDYMQKRAQAALRGKVALPGVEAKDEYK